MTKTAAPAQKPKVTRMSEAKRNAKPKPSPSDLLLDGTTAPRRIAKSKIKATDAAKHAEVLKNVGVRLRRARELNSLSVVEAAKLFGFSNPSSISKLEMAKHVTSIPVWFLSEASSVYEVSADYLLGITDELSMQPRMQFDRETSKWLQAAIERMRDRDMLTLAALHGEIVCALEVERDLTITVQEVERAFVAFVQQNPRFNSAMKGGAWLKRTIEDAMQTAASAAAKLTKFRSQMHAVRSQTSLPENTGQLDLLSGTADDGR